MPRKKPKRNDVPAKIDANVMKLVRIVASYEDKEFAELISEILAPVLEKRLAEHQAKGLPPARPRRGKP